MAEKSKGTLVRKRDADRARKFTTREIEKQELANQYTAATKSGDKELAASIMKKYAQLESVGHLMYAVVEGSGGRKKLMRKMDGTQDPEKKEALRKRVYRREEEGEKRADNPQRGEEKRKEADDHAQRTAQADLDRMPTSAKHWVDPMEIYDKVQKSDNRAKSRAIGTTNRSVTKQPGTTITHGDWKKRLHGYSSN